MELEWMGRYRELVRSVVYFSNSSNRSVMRGNRGSAGFELTQQEWQVLEYICEFEDQHKIMADISRDLGIIPSNITKATKGLLAKGLIEKNHIVGNKKNVVLTPTESGKKMYFKILKTAIQPAFEEFFRKLDSVDEDQLKIFEDALYTLSGRWSSLSDKKELEKIDDE